MSRRDTNPINSEPPKVLLSEEDKEAFRQMDELQLAIDNPMAYEQQQIDSDIDSLLAKENNVRPEVPEHW